MARPIRRPNQIVNAIATVEKRLDFKHDIHVEQFTLADMRLFVNAVIDELDAKVYKDS